MLAAEFAVEAFVWDFRCPFVCIGSFAAAELCFNRIADHCSLEGVEASRITIFKFQ